MAEEGRTHGQNVMVWVDKKDGKEYRLSFEHAKLLYMVSFYAVSSKNEDQPETWMRELPLNVMMYEGIVAGKLDFDYAPISRLFSYVEEGGGTVVKRRFLNFSEEGMSAIEDLREQEFLLGLKLTNHDDITMTAVQVSHKGRELLAQLAPMLRLEVEEFVYHHRKYASNPHPKKDLKNVLITPDDILLVTLNGYEAPSGVSETEDVSYVTSPFLPWLLRRGDLAMSDNADRAWESGKGVNQVKGDLSESIILSQVYVMLCEWLPVGPNQLNSLMNRMGAGRRYAGGLMTSAVDREPDRQSLVTRPGLTKIRFLDFAWLDAVNVEAEIVFPEAEGVKQVEHVGIHISVDGNVCFGARVEAILDRLADDVSMDLMCRMLVDLEQDSSQILDDLLSPTQRAVLDIVYRSNPADRTKFRAIFCDKAEPVLTSSNYMDHGEYENELRQVLGSIREAHDVGSKGEVIVLGSTGALIIGHAIRKFDKLVLAYCNTASLSQFQSHLFTRTLKTVKDLQLLKDTCNLSHQDPRSVDKARQLQDALSKELGFLNQALESVVDGVRGLIIPALPSDEMGRNVHQALNIKLRVQGLDKMSSDLRKLIRGCTGTFEALGPVLKSLQVIQEASDGEAMVSATQKLVQIATATKVESASYRVMVSVLAAAFALIMGDSLISARAKALDQIVTENVNGTGGTGFDLAAATNLGSSLASNTTVDESTWPLAQWAVALDQIPIFSILLHLIIMGIGLYILSKVLANKPIPTRDCVYLLATPVFLPRLMDYLTGQKAQEGVSRDLAHRGDNISDMKREKRDLVLKTFKFTPEGGRLRWRGKAPQVSITIDSKLSTITKVALHREEVSGVAWLDNIPFFTTLKRFVLIPLMLALAPLRFLVRRYFTTTTFLKMRGDVDDELFETFMNILKRKGVFELSEVLPEIEEDDDNKIVETVIEDTSNINPPPPVVQQEEPEMDDDMASEKMEEVTKHKTPHRE